jgi:hypothetical protein
VPEARSAYECSFACFSIFAEGERIRHDVPMHERRAGLSAITGWIFFNCRPMDLQFLLGDWVVVLLPETPKDSAEEFAQRVCGGMEENANWHLLTGSSLNCPVVFSVVSFPNDGTAREIFARISHLVD